MLNTIGSFMVQSTAGVATAAQLEFAIRQAIHGDYSAAITECLANLPAILYQQVTPAAIRDRQARLANPDGSWTGMGIALWNCTPFSPLAPEIRFQLHIRALTEQVVQVALADLPEDLDLPLDRYRNEIETIRRDACFTATIDSIGLGYFYMFSPLSTYFKRLAAGSMLIAGLRNAFDMKFAQAWPGEIDPALHLPQELASVFASGLTRQQFGTAFQQALKEVAEFELGQIGLISDEALVRLWVYHLVRNNQSPLPPIAIEPATVDAFIQIVTPCLLPVWEPYFNSSTMPRYLRLQHVLYLLPQYREAIAEGMVAGLISADRFDLVLEAAPLTAECNLQ